jgi:DNA-binding transcriptional regulator GbsR (MarR family)
MDDETVINEIIEEIGNLLGEMGFPPITTKAWAILYFKGNKTQNELKKELKCGLSSISQAINVLEKFGIVYISGKDGRKNIYSAEKSFKTIKRKKMEALLMFHIDPMKNLLDKRIEMISNKELKDKVKELKNMYSGCGAIIKLILKTPYDKESKK